MRAKNNDCPEALLAAVDAATAKGIVGNAVSVVKEERPFQNLGIIFGLFLPCTLHLGNGWYCGMVKYPRRVLALSGRDIYPGKTC